MLKFTNVFACVHVNLRYFVTRVSLWCRCLCRSDRPRRAAVINYIADGVMSDTDEALLNGVPVIKKS